MYQKSHGRQSRFSKNRACGKAQKEIHAFESVGPFSGIRQESRGGRDPAGPSGRADAAHPI